MSTIYIHAVAQTIKDGKVYHALTEDVALDNDKIQAGNYNLPSIAAGLAKKAEKQVKALEKQYGTKPRVQDSGKRTSRLRKPRNRGSVSKGYSRRISSH